MSDNIIVFVWIPQTGLRKVDSSIRILCLTLGHANELSIVCYLCLIYLNKVDADFTQMQIYADFSPISCTTPLVQFRNR